MSDIDVTFGADTGDLKRGTDDAKRSLRSVDDETGRLTKSLNGMARGLLAAFSVRAIVAFTQAIGDAAERTDQLAQITGLSSREVRQWGTVAQASGKSVEDIVGAVGKLELSFTKAAAGSKKQADAFRELGIDIRGVKSANDALLQVADKFSKMEDGPRKYALAVALMSKNGKEMIPILNGGSDALRQQMQAATDLGAVWGRTAEEQDEFEKKGLAVDAAMDELGMGLSGLGNMLVDALAPAIIATVEAMSNMVRSMVESYRNGGIVKGIMETLVVTFKVVATAVAMLGNLFSAAFRVAVVGAVYAVAAIDAVATAIKRLLSGDFNGAGRAFSDSFRIAGSIAAEQDTKARAQAASTRDYIRNLWSGGGGIAQTPRPRGGFDTSGGDGGGAAKAAADKAAQEALRAKLEQLSFEQDMARDNFDEIMRLEEEKLTLLRQFYGEDSQEYTRELRNKARMLQRHNDEELRWAQSMSRQRTDIETSELDTLTQIQLDKNREQEAIVDQRLARGEINERQAVELKRRLAEERLQIEMSYEDMVYQMRMASLDEQIAMDGISLDAQRQLNAEKERLEAEHQNSMRMIRRKGEADVSQGSRDASDATVNHWKKILGPIGGTFAQVTQGLLTHTTSWRDAFLQIGNQILSQFIGWAVDMGVNWLAMELAKTTATTAGVATRTGVEATGAATSKSISVGTALVDIASSAARAAAGAYAAIAGIPVIGPFLAPVVAGGALAAVLALGKTVFSAEQGWGDVSHDGATTTLHRKEMVLPANIASPLRTALSSGQLGGEGAPSSRRQGGGGDIYINAMDSRDVKRFLEKNGDGVRRSLERQARDLRVRSRN